MSTRSRSDSILAVSKKVAGGYRSRPFPTMRQLTDDAGSTPPRTSGVLPE
jgi:hypothetical protein